MKTTHNLDFLVAPWGRDDWLRFKVGTCHGLWRCTSEAYEILSIVNNEPGNGHFEDVIEWFESSAKRDNKWVVFMEVWNTKLLRHLIEKRGFQRRDLIDHVNAVKFFNQ